MCSAAVDVVLVGVSSHNCGRCRTRYCAVSGLWMTCCSPIVAVAWCHVLIPSHPILNSSPANFRHPFVYTFVSTRCNLLRYNFGVGPATTRLVVKNAVQTIMIAILPSSDVKPKERDAVQVPAKFVCYSVGEWS